MRFSKQSIIGALLAFLLVSKSIAQDKNTEFRNGNWFNGKSFQKRTFYVVNQTLTRQKPGRIDTVIDLQNQFVVPPFGEAYNHVLEQPGGWQEMNEKYLRQGIFYVKNPNAIAVYTNQTRLLLNKPSTVDIVYANGGLTASAGHPVALYKRLWGYKMYKPEWTTDSLENKAFYIMDKTDVEKKWPDVLADKPDFIKTYLLASNHVNPSGMKGLDPKLFSQIVKKAHAAGLRVSTHVETAADFHEAVLASTDEINHLPGYYLSPKEVEKTYVPTEQDAKLAAQKKIFLVTTASLATGILKYEKDTARFEKCRKQQIENLRLLHQNGVKLCIGVDNYFQTAADEMQYLRELAVFDNVTLLKFWCENTAQPIFPNRKIGLLQEGYEASFLVLAGNPLVNLDHTAGIVLRIKQGQVVSMK